MKEALKNLDVNGLLKDLAKKRPLFHNERDFQFEIAQLIKEKYDCDIRLEYYYGNDTNAKRCYIDLVAMHNNYKIAFELKYRTKKFEGTVKDEKFDLKEQGARDWGCIYVHTDLHRLEDLVNKKEFEKGYVIFLTNDEKFRDNPFKKGSMSEQFSLTKDTIKGTVKFQHEENGKKHEETSVKNCAESYKFNGKYPIKWNEYRYPKTVDDKFKVHSLVLCVEKK
ncbi:hypothetical protein [Ruminococcus albus]|uniref:Uncharacterized protein n=1 Tax=Ruminococcus albus TaxID=1264 RepID=A0A1I1CWH9_RUMAL|nr:hypothetical protein [Ruminococcus albus]SFB66442.1 hypothetical protein SAMN02910406_00073 [Ruminococcus albus]